MTRPTRQAASPSDPIHSRDIDRRWIAWLGIWRRSWGRLAYSLPIAALVGLVGPFGRNDDRCRRRLMGNIASLNDGHRPRPGSKSGLGVSRPCGGLFSDNIPSTGLDFRQFSLFYSGAVMVNAPCVSLLMGWLSFSVMYGIRAASPQGSAEPRANRAVSSASMDKRTHLPRVGRDQKTTAL